MKNLKKPFLYLIIFLLAFGNLAMGAASASSSKAIQDGKQKTEQKLVKSFSKQGEEDQYKPGDKVRVIVELLDEPVMFSAQSTGESYSELSASKKDALKRAALDAQAKVKANIEKASIPMEYKESFTTVVNGFSGEVTYKSIEVLESLPNVGNVYVSNKYERPEEQPEMLYSKELVKAQQTWQEYGYKGEGMTVAVIDTGIDPEHRDMVLSEETVPELSEQAVGDMIEDKDLLGKYYSEKVPYAYNYADQNHQILDIGPDASMHGMHVSGTVGANGDEENGGLKGVAPEAQILGMKVFGNDPEMPSTWSDIYVKAIDEAIILGADVINMSLGSTASFVNPEDPEQKAVSRAVENGVMMAISAGNSDRFGSGHGDPFASNPDIGLVGAPGLAGESLQVASFENEYLDLDGFSVQIDGEEADPVAFLSASSVDPSSLGEGYFEIVDAGLGRVPGDSDVAPDANDFEGVDVEGKIALIQRGESAFVDKTLNAQERGAIGVIIYNNVSGYISMASSGEINIPQLAILKTTGDELKAALDEDKNVEIAFQGETVTSLNPEHTSLSAFTSWGVTPNLDFKPEITAPGGNILSTLNDNEYGLMSGTSMAAPHVAGGSALVMQRVDEDFGLSGSDRVHMAKNILMNTSKPQMDTGLYNDYYALGLPYSPRRQGAGLMDLHAAMSTPVVATEVESGMGKVALKEIDDEATFTLQLTNVTDESAVYEANGTVQTDLVMSGANYVETAGIYKEGTISGETLKGEFPISITSANGSEVNGDYQVLVPANDTVEVEVSIDLTDSVDWAYEGALDELFENGYFVEGFVSFTDVNDVNPPLTVPYVGFNGEWDQAPIVDDTIYEDNTFYNETGLVTPDGDDYRFLGTNPVSDEAHGDKVAFSPNNDGVSDWILPSLSFLRNAKNVKFKVLDEDQEEILTLRTQNEVRKHYFDGGAGEKHTDFAAAAWNGKFKGNVLEDGLYHYEIESVIDYPDAEWQSKVIPFYVDTTKPTVSASYDAASNTVTWSADDEGAGVSHFDILVDGKSVLETPLAADQAAYVLEGVDKFNFVKVVAVDWAGNTASDTIGEDTTIPFISAVTPAALSVSDERVVPVAGYINDSSSVESLTINGKETTLTWNKEEERYEFNTTVEFKNDGVQEIRFIGVDTEGNEISFLRKIFVDSTNPVLDVDAPFFTDEDSVSLNVDLTDNFSEMRFYINGSEKFYKELREPYVMETFNKSLTEELALEDGANEFELKLVDLAGNTTAKNITIFKTAKTPKAFKDVYSTFWAKDEIETLNVQGVINGYDDGNFGVADNIYRIQAAQMIVRALDLDTADRPNPNLKDIKPGDYGYDVIAAVADEGIMTGNDDGDFDAWGTLTRAQMAKIIVEAYELKGTAKSSFKDVPVGYWAAGYIDTLAANGITTGYEDNTFKPQNKITRSQFAAFLARTQDDRFK
ncbi:S8 family serine peptidase [Rossellomorea vietnamensis]|uniref:S8 family serine peptidase n=1 Tax=Rossellomorea vietnamensis TaxID=218284 RepID=A0A5D4M049_9BACI|nr:S8 family serine peptidase [Rossellomorea vietnamensis]TYR94872.1 S8 family serine peptidase [Rossellomorea vietnamensis]